MTKRPPPLDCWRNRLAQRLANLCLLVATDEYRQLIDGAIRLGMYTAAGIKYRDRN